MDWEIREIEEADIPELERLKCEQGEDGSLWVKRFEWQFLGNPARCSGRPLGWVVESPGGRLHAHQMAMPEHFRVFDSEQILAFSADTYVTPLLRGQGLGGKLFKTYFEAQRGRLAVTTTANPASEYLWLQKFDAVSIGDLNKSFLFIFRSEPPIREFMLRLFRHRWIRFPTLILGCFYDLLRKKSLPGISDSIVCEQVRPDDPKLDEIWRLHKNDCPVMAVRDGTYRDWRYNKIPGTKPTLWLVTDENAGLDAWFALRVVERGASEVKVCELLDVFGPFKPDRFQREVLALAVHVGYETGADLLEVKGLHQSWRSHLLSLGFISRTLPSNPFLYKNMSAIQDSALRETMSWHICVADGDAGI